MALEETGTIYDITVITNLGELQSMRADWNDLVDNSENPTVFSEWAWQFCCASHLLSQRGLRIILVRSGMFLVAALPMCLSGASAKEGLGRSVLTCLGGEITDYNAFIARRGHESVANELIREYLLKENLPIELGNVLDGSGLQLLVDSLSKKYFYRVVVESKVALQILFPRDLDSYWHRLGGKFRREIERGLRNLHKLDTNWSMTESSNTSSLADLADLHNARWQGKGERGALADESIREFHNDLLSESGDRFEVKVYRLEALGTTIAVGYGFIHRGVFFYYLSGFNPKYSKLSPGNVLIGQFTRVLHEAGISTIDLLRGDLRYKRMWATSESTVRDLILFPATWKGFLLSELYSCLNTAKRLIPRRLKEVIKSLGNRGAS